MVRPRFTLKSFLFRVLFALILVFATYNPLEGSYYHWALKPLLNDPAAFTILKGLVGVALLIGWGVFLGATFKSLGGLGTIMLTVLFALFIWLLIDKGWISLDEPTTMSWLVLLALSGVLATGISWSHIRRRLTGQVDVDEADQ